MVVHMIRAQGMVGSVGVRGTVGKGRMWGGVRLGMVG